MSVRATALRRANRLNNKTPLHVYRGHLDGAETVLVDQEEVSQEQKLVSGVEREELQEHHLQAALARGSLIHSQPSNSTTSGGTLPASPSFKQAAAQPATQSLPAYHIPTPDAGGIVRDYDALYGSGSGRSTWDEPRNYIKFSDKVEECCYGWGGLGYDMDDADVAWLKAFNAKEEGTSEGAVAAANASPSSVANGVKAKLKGKDKEKEANGPLKISEDEFEYVMGMLELWTDRNVPMLHTNLALMPAFAAVESIFAQTPPASFYPSYEVPRNVLPQPRFLVRMARNIFPYWKSRREQRKGHRIIPQLNFDETNDGDPYVCFRRRDVKVTRKTRQKDMLVVDRMRNVQVEMLAATKIVALVLEREKEKAKAMRSEKEHWEARWNFMQFKRKNPQNPITPEEEAMLFPERRQPPMAASQQQNNAAGLAASQARKSRGEREREEMQRGQVGGIAPRLPKSRAVSPSGGDRVPPEQLAALYSKRVEEEMRRRKEMDRGWEDSADVGYHPIPPPVSQRHFRHLPLTELPSTRRRPAVQLSRIDRPSSPEPEASGRSDHPAAFRMRRGRGGIMRLDRRGGPNSVRSRRSLARGGAGAERKFARWNPFEDVYSQLPRARTSRHDETVRSEDRMDVDGEESEERDDPESVEERERARILSERWRYDADMGAVGLGMGVDDEDQIVIDDYEVEYIKYRSSMIKSEDLSLFSAPMSALEKVRQALSVPPPQPSKITFMPQQPQPAPMMTLQQQQMLQQQQLAVQQRAQQAQYDLKRAGVPMQNGAGQPVNGQLPPQVRRMVSTGPNQMGMARPSQSPVPGMQQGGSQQQQMAQQQLQQQQQQQLAQAQLTPQQLAARAAQYAQMQNGQRPSPQVIQAMAAAHAANARLANGVGQPLMNGGPHPLQGGQPMMQSASRTADGHQPMQVDSPHSSARTPANAGQLQLPQVSADGTTPNGGIGQQRSPRQPLSQPNPMPNGVGLPMNLDPAVAAVFANAVPGLNGAAANLTPAQQEKLRAALEKRAGTPLQPGQNLPAAAAAMFAQNGSDGSMVMNLKLPQARANQIIAAQNNLRATSSPVNSNTSPRVQQQQPSMV